MLGVDLVEDLPPGEVEVEGGVVTAA